MGMRVVIRTLLRTKLYRPRVDRAIVPRMNIRHRIEEGLQGDLTLVTAPAGYGKTTAVAEWAAHTDSPVTWLMLDEYDNELIAFLAYAIAAVRILHQGACSDLEGLLGLPELPDPEWLAVVFCKEIDDLPERFVLVLDDFHLVTDPAVHQFIDALLRRPPLQMHLLITSRVQPPLMLNRLRANRRLNELHTDDLRFSREETEKLFSVLAAKGTSGPALNGLRERTEGWVAGLHLAALTLARTPDAATAATGKPNNTSRLITSYLVEQVLQQQSPAMQTFLLKTSILERISPALAAAVIDGDAKTDVISVDALKRAGIFLTVLDDQGEWYVYHSLFGEMLQQQLQATLPVSEVAGLHGRASLWFAQNGFFDEALRHAFAAGDEEAAGRIVVDHFPSWLETDVWRTINRRIDMFPAGTIEQNPWLLVVKGHMLHLQYKSDAVLPVLQRVESLLDQGPTLAPAQERLLRGYLHTLWAVHWSLQTDAPRTKAAALKALEHLPEEHLYARGILLITLTIAQQTSGEADAAEQFLNRTLARAAMAPMGERAVLRPLMCLLSLYFAEGFVAQAMEIAQTLLQKALELQSLPNQVWAHLTLGAAHYEMNDLERAEQHFESVLKLRHAAHARAVHESLVGLALTHQAMGRRQAVQGTLAAMAEFHQELVSPTLAVEAVSLRRRLAALNGEPEPGAVREGGIPPRTAIWYGWMEIPALTSIRVALARRDPADWAQTETALEQLLLTAAQLHKQGCLVTVLTLKAVLHMRQKNQVTALHVLRQALAIGEPRGLVRSIVDAGPQLKPLLAIIAGETPSAYLQQLIAAVDGPAAPRTAPQAPPSAAPLHLPTHLTRREREVLMLLGQQRTDREIADTLVISPLTVRTHIENLSSKLSVNGRRAIVMRARERGLLS